MAKFREIFRGKAKYVTVRAESEPVSTKKEVPDGLWTKCPECGAMLYQKDLERNLHVCDKCGYHFRIGARTRIAQLVDDLEQFVEIDEALVPTNPLDFPDYPEKLEATREKTGLRDAVVTGIGRINGVETVLAVMDFHFMGGSMGSVVGERVTRAFEKAGELGLPIVTVSASGGARMQEGILSLMQMEKTCAAVERFHRKGLLFISILADPTTAGVFGSFASLGDINIAEPGATVGFAGQRVIEETIRKAVPPSLQKAETVFTNGFIDMIVPRSELKKEVGKLLLWHTAKGPIAPEAAPSPGDQETAESSAESAPENTKLSRTGDEPALPAGEKAPGESGGKAPADRPADGRGTDGAKAVDPTGQTGGLDGAGRSEKTTEDLSDLPGDDVAVAGLGSGSSRNGASASKNGSRKRGPAKDASA